MTAVDQLSEMLKAQLEKETSSHCWSQKEKPGGYADGIFWVGALELHSSQGALY